MIQAALAALASIPCAAWLSGSEPKRRVTRANLREVRYLLLPGLRGINQEHPEIELDIHINGATESLLVTGFVPSNNRSLGFALTKLCIEDRRFGEFAPNVETLIRCLKMDDEQYRKNFGSEGFSFNRFIAMDEVTS